MTVRYEPDGPLVVVTIDRPDVRNAVDPVTASRLVECFERFDADDALAVAVLTGAVVGLQPFGGARASGTNDKAGSILNLIRWTSPRVIKETYAPPTDHRYPFMDAE